MEISTAAAVAAIGVDLLVHPLDTLITRVQSAQFDRTYRNTNGSLQPHLFRGLYNGIEPVLVTTVPASVAFFGIYESSKCCVETMIGRREPSDLSRAFGHATSSAVAEMAACAIINPAEVLKQNAQVAQASGLAVQKNHVLVNLRKLGKNPRAMWAGYSALLASRLPSTSLTFSLFEIIKGRWDRNRGPTTDVPERIRRSAFAGGAAAAAVSVVFVPIDVVKTRIRLMAVGPQYISEYPPRAPRPLLIARQLWVMEGFSGFFRGASLTGFTAAIGGALYLGCYDGLRMYYAKQTLKDENKLLLK